MAAVPAWATALGEPLFPARIRMTPAAFCVTEICNIEFSGAGEHDFLWVEKCGQNTQWVAEQLAQHGKVPVRDVGFAGMKDRHAITRQWFSVRRVGSVDWDAFSADGVEILNRQQHHRKLRRGAHAGNSFRIIVRAERLQDCGQQLERRLTAIAANGVPNYFGEQRFGRDGNNVDLSRRLFAGKRMSRGKRSIALSVARSLIFNAILEKRVRGETWNQILPGELANLDGSASVFAVAEVTAELVQRCVEQDIHPSGSLWGDGSPRATDEVAGIESSIAVLYREFVDGLVAARMQPGNRALRMLVRNLHWQMEGSDLQLDFELAKGGYATAVLREIATLQIHHSHDDGRSTPDT